MNMQEATQALIDMKAQNERNRVEVVTKITALEDAVRNAGAVTPEFEAALLDLKGSVQAADDDVKPAAPDVPV